MDLRPLWKFIGTVIGIIVVLVNALKWVVVTLFKLIDAAPDTSSTDSKTKSREEYERWLYAPDNPFTPEDNEKRRLARERELRSKEPKFDCSQDRHDDREIAPEHDKGKIYHVYECKICGRKRRFT